MQMLAGANAAMNLRNAANQRRRIRAAIGGNFRIESLQAQVTIIQVFGNQPTARRRR
jgi:hypothetical protein